MEKTAAFDECNEAVVRNIRAFGQVDVLQIGTVTAECPENLVRDLVTPLERNSVQQRVPLYWLCRVSLEMSAFDISAV